MTNKFRLLDGDLDRGVSDAWSSQGGDHEVGICSKGHLELLAHLVL